MFTGIVQVLGKITKITKKNNFRSLEVTLPSEYLANVELGASIAINGCCLTVTAFENSEAIGQVYFDVIDETLRLTNLGALQEGDQVNVERSLKFGDEIGGHLVSGHIQTTARIGSIIRTPDNCRIYLELSSKHLKYILPKGFVAVDGASLTVGEVDAAGFWLHLIPETLERTTLGTAQERDKVNIEWDQQTVTIIHTVEQFLLRQQAAQ